jgi:hypothetical protein
MKVEDALDILRAQGYGVGTPDAHAGRVRVWRRESDDAVDVETGRELFELAEGKVSFEEILERHRKTVFRAGSAST